MNREAIDHYTAGVEKVRLAVRGLTRDDLIARPDPGQRFALRVLKLVQSLPRAEEARTIGRQLLRSGTSVGANYRAVCRSRSRKEFISKMNVVVEEADETVFWFEVLVEGAIVRANRMKAILDEGNQLLAIFAASLRTAKRPRLSS